MSVKQFSMNQQGIRNSLYV